MILSKEKHFFFVIAYLNLIIVMRTFNFFKKIAYSFSNEPKLRKVILTHNSPFSNYTFLGINLSDINSQFVPIMQQAKSAPLQSFMKAVNQHRVLIKKVQQINFGWKNLKWLEDKLWDQYDILFKYRNELTNLKEQYALLYNFVFTNVNNQNIFVWLEVCNKLQIMQWTLWSKFFSIISESFISFNMKEQEKLIKYTHEYIKKNFVSFTFVPSKFVYRENFLVDIADFRGLLKTFIDFIVRSSDDSGVLKLRSLQKINDLIEKISKIYVMNFSQMVEHFIKNKQSFNNLIKMAPVQILVEVLRYLGIIGMYDEKFYCQIQEKLAGRWKYQVISNQMKGKIISRVLSIWASGYRHNQLMLKTLIKPFIEEEISNKIATRYHSIWLFHMVACNIRDIQFLQRFYNKIIADLPMSNKYLHIVSHYLAIISNSRRSDAYPSCAQHPIASKIVSIYGKSHLNCMQRKKNGDQGNHQQLTFVNELGIQENPSEVFWLHVARKAFEVMSKRYPHPDNCIHFDFSFCVFQIDAIILLRGVPIAFELGGSHYNLKEVGQNGINQAQGKKMIKRIILTGYKIRMLDINSTNVIERNINSFYDIGGGIKYIIQKLQRILQTTL